MDEYKKIKEDIERRDRRDSTLCDYCREEIHPDQVVCPRCGRIQTLKLEKLPMEAQKNFTNLSQLMQQGIDSWNPDICWNVTAKKCADRISAAREIARNAGLLENFEQLEEDINQLIDHCRSAEFQIAIVGIVKSGKSTLMNALIGEELAASDVNPYTATLTKFRSTSQKSYIKVYFYDRTEWEKLNISAEASKTDLENKDIQEIPLYKKLADPAVQNAAKAHFDTEPLIIEAADLNVLKDEIKHWTTIASDDHLIAREVEVYINEQMFNMPKQIVFVDTPGLCDCVKYRSETTERYLGQADAVLIANNLESAWSEEVRTTITRTYECVGSAKKERIYLIGTKKDKCNDAKEYTDRIIGAGGWIDKLLACGLYKEKSDAKNHIILSSAYVYLLMKRAIRTSPKEYQSNFSKAEYSKLKSIIEQIGDYWDYTLADFPYDNFMQGQLENYCGISALKGRLQEFLIKDWEEYKINDIKREYLRCKNELKKVASNAANEKMATLQAAKGGAEGIKKRQREKALERKRIADEEKAIEEILQKLKKTLDIRIRKIQNADRTVNK